MKDIIPMVKRSPTKGSTVYMGKLKALCDPSAVIIAQNIAGIIKFVLN
jgi:hypothetical protein